MTSKPKTLILSSESFHYIETYKNDSRFILVTSANPQRTKNANNCINLYSKWIATRVLDRLSIPPELNFFISYLIWAITCITCLPFIVNNLGIKYAIIPACGYQAPSWLLKLLKIKLVVDCVNIYPNVKKVSFCSPKIFIDTFFYNFRCSSIANLVQISWLLLTPSSHVKDSYNKFSKRKIILPYSTFLDKNLDQHALNLQRKHNFTITNILRIGIIGAVSPRKNQELVAEALLKLIKENFTYDSKIKIVLDIVGNKNVNRELVQKIANIKNQNLTILLHGHLARGSFNQLKNSWHLYVQPSVFEGFAISLVECWMSGLPIIASIKSGANDLLDKKSVEILPNLTIDALKNSIYEAVLNIDHLLDIASDRDFNLHLNANYRNCIIKYIS
jgi:glycosyltransferase involved in cell wall biosynthesis